MTLHFLFVTYTIIQSITSSEICPLHLNHPSAHTLEAVSSRRCGAREAVGGSVSCSRVSPQSWTIPARAGSRDSNPQPRVTSPMLYLLDHSCPIIKSYLHLTHPKCIRTHSSGQPCYGTRGAVGGSVPCSRAAQSWY